MSQAGALPSVTVVVCTRNRPEALASCLDALARQRHAPSETLVVDNGTAPSVEDLCARWGARYAWEPRPGLCFARNTGVRLATGDIVAFIDDDAVPDRGWLQALIDGFSDSTVAGVTGTIGYVATSHGSRVLPAGSAPPRWPSRPREAFDRHSPNWFARACFGGVGDGSNMAFRRRVLVESPGFDNRLGRGRVLEGGDESVFFMALLALGHRLAHVPEAMVAHPFPGDTEALQARALRERRNAVAYFLFLWSDFPANRRDLARHLVGAVVRRLWRRREPIGSMPRLTMRQAWRAVREGISLFRKARREWHTIPAPDYQTIVACLERQ